MIKKKYYLFIIFFIFFLDRITKIIVINYTNNSNSLDLFNSKYLNFSLIWNPGIAFGLMSFENNFFYNLFSFFIFCVIIFLIILTIKAQKFEKISFSMIIGGALGNFYDRIQYKAVPDFIDFHYNNFHWFTFNVADVFISVGVMLLIFYEFTKKKEKNV